MASKRTAGTRQEMIHCDRCGEDYAASYKSCPFCDEMEYEEEGRPRGGRRLAGNTRGGGYGGGPSVRRIILTVLSLALIVAAVMIVISIIKPLVDRGQTTLPEDSPAQNTQQLDSPAPGETGTPEDTTPPEASAEPVIPDDQTATGFTLSKSEFTLSDTWPDPITLTVTFLPAGSTGTITWTSSDPEIASVDENGKVSHGTKTGTATITAAMAGGITQTCKVYNSVTSGAASSAGGTSTALSLNKTDFTFSSKSEPAVYMKVNGTSSAPSWSIGDTSVATISADGVVRPVGRGTTTITCKVDGQTLKCIVRCNF